VCVHRYRIQKKWRNHVCTKCKTLHVTKLS
jgi:hypothetical protein